MAKEIIGIKLADNTLYPILETGKKAKKRLVLEPAKPEQREVHIDIYSAKEEPTEPQKYIGTITIELPEEEEVKEIELVIGLDEEGHLEARARDLHSDNQQSLTITIADNMQEDSLSDFSMVEDEPFDSLENDFDEFPQDSNKAEDSEPYVWDEPEEESDEFQDSWSETSSREQELLQEDFANIKKEKQDDKSYESSQFTRYGNQEKTEKKKNSLPAVIIGIVIGIILGAIALFMLYPIFNHNSKEAIKTEESSTKEPVKSIAPSPIPTPTQTPVAENKQQEESTSIIYTPGWGDTLWDLAKSFYDNPWLYPDIAKENNIKNPDLIYAGKPLKIPGIKKAK
ncbi:LysM domain-containing protein [Spirochaetia bacterium 38H-sp]|uniref:LysM domain-containing protein n=1 Tax=Rarispira pelagica TaxID=3141764 RepID=A0ABU9U8T0_9SPIR